VATRELSTAWWNVIRRQMRATPAEEDSDVRCPDCDGPMYLMKGRYGRFYKCNRYECKGTHGATLAGKARKPKGSATLLMARKRARVAMSVVFAARDDLHQTEMPDDVEHWSYPTYCSCGKEWYHLRPKSGDAKPDLKFIIEEAGLVPTTLLGSYKAGLLSARAEYKLGIHIQRRSVDECLRIEAAAKTRYEWLVEEKKLVECRRRGNAWDHVYVGTLDEATA
jgi:ssDNA-binding Zn-finger/Zn-ribbon topoisomerase 1